MSIDNIDRTKRYPKFSVGYKEAQKSMQPALVELKIDNVVVPQGVIESMILDQVLGEHTMLVLELRRRPELETNFGSTLEANTKKWISKTVSLKITAADKSGGDKGEVNFTGIVGSAVMGSVIGSLGNIYLRCFSPTIALDINQMFRTWRDATSNDIINNLVSQENLPNTKISVSDGTKLPGFLAYGQTAFEIINYLAGFEGWWAYYDGLNYVVTKELPDNSIELKANQVGAFVVSVDALSLKKIGGRSFEYGSGKWFQSQGGPAPSSAHVLGQAGSKANHLSSIDEYLRLKHVPISQSDLDKRLDSALRKNYVNVLKCNGITDRLGVSIGKVLKLKWEGQTRQTESRREEELSGQYLITRVIHKYDDGQYSCDFKGVDRSLAHPYYDLNEFPTHASETAEVTSVDDPENLGRIQVRFGWSSSGGEVESPFIRVRQDMAGATPHGDWLMPEIGDNVLVSINGPHLENAIVIGSFYDGSRKPRNDLPGKDNNLKSFYTRSGNELTFSDEKDKEKITLTTKNAAAIVILDAASGSEKLSLAAKKDEASIVLDGTQKVTIETKSSGCKISLDGSGKAITIEAGQTINLKANEINIEANANLNLKANAQFKQKSGAMIEIDGGGMTTIKGGLVKIN
jgi:type VI secretion system secreted protein VgrG